MNINKACPVCRTSIQYSSTSLAVDNFITSLCQLIGGYFKERRESIQNLRECISCIYFKIYLCFYKYILISGDLSISQSILNDTYISRSETTVPMTHPNMVRLTPCRQQPPTPVSTENPRQPIVSSNNTPHHNIVQLLPYPQSSTVANSRNNRLQHPSTTSTLNSRVHRFQPVPSTSVSTNIGSSTRLQSNIVRLSPYNPRTNSSLK